MKKYEIRIKKAGWEKEEIPDQLFIPPKFKVRLKPEQLDFNPDRFKPVRTRRGVPKPSGGLWTSDYDYENNLQKLIVENEKIPTIYIKIY